MSNNDKRPYSVASVLCMSSRNGHVGGEPRGETFTKGAVYKMTSLDPISGDAVLINNQDTPHQAPRVWLATHFEMMN